MLQLSLWEKTKMKVKRLKIMAWCCLCFGFFGCDAERKYEDYNLPDENALTLTQDNHPHGFGQTECFYCHVKANIHEVDRLRSALFPLAKSLVEEEGIHACSTCHGNNKN